MNRYTLTIHREGDYYEFPVLDKEFVFPHEELLLWWTETTLSDLLVTAPKIEEYGGEGGDGSADLEMMGENLAKLLKWRDAPDAVKQELACWLYATGKTSRLISDYQLQRAGKPDTWMDLGFYSLMARRLQHSGRWP